MANKELIVMQFKNCAISIKFMIVFIIDKYFISSHNLFFYHLST